MKKIFSVFIIYLLFLLGSQSFASSIIPAAVAPKPVLQSMAESGNLLFINPANSAGISYNKFDQFDIDANGVKIINGSAQGASLIVITADNINLNGKVEIVGPRTDILFLSSKANSVINCNYCSVINANRVTLSTAANTVSTASPAIGNLTTQGAVNINHINTQGSLSLELIARNISLNGTVNTHQIVNDQKIATGGMQVLLGALTWNYDNEMISNIKPSAATTQLNGVLLTKSLKVLSANNLIINSVINNKAHKTSVSLYNGRNYVPTNKITAEVFANQLTLKSIFNIEGLADMKSAGHLTVEPSAQVHSDEIQLIAKNRIFNNGLLNAEKTKLAGANILNRNRIIGSEIIELASDNHIANEFGGVITGKDVLVNAGGIFRNGMRYPFLSNGVNDAFNTNLLDIDAGYLVNPNYFIKQTGTMFRNGMNYELIGNKSRHELPMAANISASNLKLKALAFENINPYFESKESIVNDLLKEGNKDIPMHLELSMSRNGEIKFDLGLRSRIKIYTSNNLLFEVNDYILNSSALIYSGNNLSLKSNFLINERFSIVNSTKIIRRDAFNITSWGWGKVLSLDILGENYQISFPGSINVKNKFFGDFENYFQNNSSFFEVFGDAHFEAVEVVNNIGVLHKYIEGNRTGHDISFIDSATNTLVNTGGGFTYHESNISIIPSLFYVYGNLTSSSSELLTSMGKTDLNNFSDMVDHIVNTNNLEYVNDQHKIRQALDWIFSKIVDIATSLNDFLKKLKWW